MRLVCVCVCVCVLSRYLNLTSKMEAALVASGASVDFLMPSPRANGFFNSPRGSPKAYIPHVYRHLAVESVKRMQQQRGGMGQRQEAKAGGGGVTDIRLHEYERPGWQFHAKGIWYSPTKEPELEGPLATFVGSPNYGYRSQDKDLELELCILAGCGDLRRRLRDEVDDLFRFSSRTEPSQQKRPKSEPLISLSSKLCRKWL